MPDPILVSIAAALAAKTATSLYDLVKRQFAGRKEAEAALDAAEVRRTDSPDVTALAAHLATEETDDPRFGEEMRRIWQHTTATQGGVVNQITGNVSGKVVQARDITGDIKF